MIKPLPLTSVFTPPRVRYFADGDAPPVIDPPAGGGGGGGDPNADILNFTPPDIGSIGEIIGGKAPAAPVEPPAKGAKPEPAAKPGDKKPAAPPAKPGAAPVEPPAKQLRDELEAVKRERDELKGTLEKGDPRIKAAEEAGKAKETEITEARTKLAEYERKLALADPAVTKELQERDSAYDTVALKFEQSVPELPRQMVHSLVSDYHNLPFGKDGYKEARAAFEQKVNLALGGSEDADHRKLGRALDFIESTHDYMLERPKIVEKINGSAFKLQAEARAGEYGKKVATVRDLLTKAKTIPDGLEKTDPFHPAITIDKFHKSLPVEQQAEFEKGIDDYVELVVAGMKPETPEEYAGMTPQQVAESKARRSATLEEARGQSVVVMRQGLMALRLFPSLVKELQRLNALVKEDGDGNPPDPTNNGDPGANRGDELEDLRNFRPPEVPRSF